MSEQAAFTRLVDRLIRESQRIPEATARRVLAQLRDARKEIAARLAKEPKGGYRAGTLQQLLSAIDAHLRDFARAAAGETAAGQAAEFDLGRRVVDEPLRAVNVPAPLVGLSRQTLAIAQEYSARLIGGVWASTRRRIDAALQRALLGGQPVDAVIGQVSRLLDGAGGRALTVVRTEVPRVFSAATQARLEQVSHTAPGVVRKEWQHNPQEHPRLQHLQMSGQVVDVAESFQVPESGEALRFPRDPAGSAAETVNCGCSMLPVVDLAKRGSTPRYGRLLAA